MTDVKTKSTRRAFFLNGGAVLGAGVAATAGAAGLAAPVAAAKMSGGAEDREAIRRLHLAFVSQLENQAHAGAASLFNEAQFAGYRQTTSQRKDEVKFNEDGLRATATFHCEVELCTPLQDDCTAAQMARLQGWMASRRWENGRFEGSYVKTRGEWQMTAVSFMPSSQEC